MPHMAKGSFHKMHGLGNDFVIVDCRNVPLIMNSAKARAISDRRSGIGCDQLILIESSDTADVRMLIFNADGGEVQSCGNATRCLVALLGHDVSIETAGGHLTGSLADGEITISLPPPRFEWQDIPLAYGMDSAAMPIAWEELSSPMAVNVGNPHAIFFVEDTQNVDLLHLGPLVEQDAIFPERVNVNVATIKGNAIDLRVWERGVGETLACGTGACATAVAAIKKGLVSSPVAVRLAGGVLSIAWQVDGPILMSGGATYVFAGTADWDDFG
jgi:diaminopimelate epimerase